ncbi:MAG: TonB-dependent receptor [Flavobacteriales bacterium]|nr:TonB-dependent receptor [Flavobacteriales bacterium]
MAQTGVIEGTVTQGKTTIGLPGANVHLEGSTVGTATNGKGQFRLERVPVGEVVVVISSIGYTSERKQLMVKASETMRLDMGLTETVLDLPEAVVSSVSLTGGLTGLKEIPGSAYYMSPKEMLKFNYTDINRTLSAVPGVNIQEEEGFGLRPNIGLRGTGSERSSKITIMEDGILMAPAPYAASAAYYFPTMGRMQAVEILKGSSQIKYGPYTTGGAINFVSTQIPNTFAGRVSISAGSFANRNIHAYVGSSHKHFGYLVEGYHYGSEGFKELDSKGKTGFTKKDLLAKVRVNTDQGAKIYQSFTVKVGYTDEVSDDTYLGLTEEDFAANPLRRYAASQKDQIVSDMLQLSATHVAQFGERFRLTTTAYRNAFNRNWYKLNGLRDSTNASVDLGALLENPTGFNDAYNVMTGDNSTQANALQVRANNRSYEAMGVQTVFGTDLVTGKVTHGIEFGLRYHVDEMDRFQWDDWYAMDNGLMTLSTEGTPGTESNRIESAQAIATYLQYKVKVGKFTATPGLRYEHITLNLKDYKKNDPARTGKELEERSNTVDVVIPGIGLDYAFSDHLNTFAGIHKGFAPPGSNEGARPEESLNYEVGVRYNRFGLSGMLVGFINDYSNLLGADLAAGGGGGTTETFNGGKARTVGVELQVTYDLLSSLTKGFGLPISVAYTYTRATFLSDFESTFEGWGTVSSGDDVPYLAPHQLNVMLSLEHKRFNVNISGKYMDAMRTQAGQGEIPADQQTDSYLVLDLSASYNLFKRVSLFGSATNVTDAVYLVARRPYGLRPGMPRAFMVGIRAGF